MKNQNKKQIKHLSVRLTWHDNGWNGNSCKDPKNNISCQQDANRFIHDAKIISNNKCCTDIANANNYINNYLNKNRCFLNYSKLAYTCKIHNSHLEDKKGISNIPPCDSFSAFKEKDPYVHTKNPARKIDKFDNIAIKNCSRNKKPWEYIRNWNQVKYFPQDYRQHIINGESIALFYTVNFPEESGKFVVGYSVIKEKNEDFITKGKGNTHIYNKSNAGNRWGEDWCFILDENDRYRFPFQELIQLNQTDLLQQVKQILKIEPQDEKFFRNLSLFIPEYILIKYLKKLQHAVSLLKLYHIDSKIISDFSNLDRKIQEIKKSYLSFKYPGLPAVGRFLQWWNAYKDYENFANYENQLKKSLFDAVKKHKYAFELNGRKFYIGSNKKGLHPKDSLSEEFINLLEDTLIYYPISNDKVIERIKLLIDKNILSINQISQNPYILYEEFVSPIDGNVILSFEDVDYGEYKKSIEKFKGKIPRNFYLNPYRIRALIHEYFKVYKDDPGFVWISFKDIESYIIKRLSTGLGTGDFELNLEEILKTDEIKETIEIDFEKNYLTLKKLSQFEREIENNVKRLLNSNSLKTQINIREALKNTDIPEDWIKEKEEFLNTLISNRFTFVSGIAGSGKSTLIKMFTELLDVAKENYKILTPTGKSSERLRQEGLESETIHYFLKSNGFIDEDLFLLTENGELQEVENLIIDEISMVPLDLFYYLLKAVNINKLKRLILVGDIKQLPPIGYGYLAKDLYHFLEKNAPYSLIKLETSYRSKDKFIELANKLRDKNLSSEDVKPFLKNKITKDNFQILKFSNQQELEDLIKEILKVENITKEKLAYDPETFQILTPKKEGYSGSDHINRFMNDYLNKDRFSWKNTKIIKLINTYCPSEDKNCVETFNGMIGTVFYKDGWKIKFKTGQVISFPPEKLGYEYDYAYGITIHKSQGSEFDTVVVILPENIGSLFTRELLYTALTRARKKLYLLIENENLLYKTPLEIERSSKLFEENLLELPESLEYISINGQKVLSKLDLYVSAILDVNKITYKYKTSNADFETDDKNIHLINLNTYEGKIKNEVIKNDDKNIKLVYERAIDIRNIIQKLGTLYPDRYSKNKEDYRENLRKNIEKKEHVYIEPDTNFKILTHNGIETRSISEAILMLLFDHLGLHYEYEKETNLNGRKILPDFFFPEKNLYWEHLGLLNDNYYVEKWIEKKKIYEDSKIKVLSIYDWKGEKNCCIYTTEEDIRNLNKLWRELNDKRNFFTTSKY